MVYTFFEHEGSFLVFVVVVVRGNDYKIHTYIVHVHVHLLPSSQTFLRGVPSHGPRKANTVVGSFCPLAGSNLRLLMIEMPHRDF